MPNVQTILRRIPFWGALALLIYMPLHVFLAQSVSLLTGGLSWWKLGKDIFLLLVGVFTICLVWRKRGRGAREFAFLLGVSTLYALLHLVMWALHRHIYANGALLGIIYNFRVFGFLLLGLGAVLVYGPKQFSYTLVLRVVLGMSSLVAALGVAQYFLPHDILTHVGYGVDRGTLPAFFIDNRPEFPRIMSTLRDPNSLGAYLLVPMALMGGLFLRAAEARRRLVIFALLVLHAAALFLTFSRGAWAAALLVAGLVFLWHYGRAVRGFLRHWWPVFIAVAVIAASGIALARNTYLFKSVVTHRTGAPQGVAYDSNGFHWVFAKKGLDGIVRNPFGYGPGTAGLASIQNPKGSFLTENYYIQIGYELGVVGLALFVLLNILVYIRLRRSGTALLPMALMASFWGYAVLNMLFHMWSNEAVAAQWWLLAGMAIALPLAAEEKEKTKAGGKNQTKNRGNGGKLPASANTRANTVK